MRTLPADAAAQLAAPFRKAVWAAHLTAAEPDMPDAVYRWASRSGVSLDGNAYSDVMSRKPSFGWATLKPHGGLGREGDCTLYLRNESGLASTVLSSHYPGGDRVEVFVLFLTGSETAASLVRVFSGVAGVPEYNGREWQLRCTGNQAADFREVPIQRVNARSHPQAQRDALGKVIPWVVGNWQATELIDDELVIDLYPLLLTNKWDGVYQGGTGMDTQGDIYLRYPQADKLALVQGTAVVADAQAGTRQVTGTERTVFLYPLLPQADNTVATWHRAANRDPSSGAQLTNGAALEVFLEEVPRLGEAYAASLEILVQANGATYDLTLVRYNKIAFTAAGLTGDTSVPLLGIDQAVTHLTSTQTLSADRTDQGIVEIDAGVTITVADGVTWTAETGENFADTWGGWAVELDGHGSKLIYQIAVVIHFDEQQSGDLTSLKAYGQGMGRRGNTNLRDGPAIVSGPLRRGVDQLQYLFRARDGFNQPVSRLDTASFAAAASGARQYWQTKVALREAHDPERLVDEWAYALGSHLHFTLDEDWRLVPRDTTRAPVHIFRRAQTAARRVEARTGTIQDAGPDGRTAQIDAQNAINDILLRYGYYGPTGDFQAAQEQTARWWASGTAAVSGNVLTDPNADFLASVIAPGHTAVFGGAEYTVTALTKTTLTLDAGAGEIASISYWVGANLSAALIYARRRYGDKENTLTRSGGGTRDGGLTARYVDYDFEADAEGQRTAERFVEHGTQWFSQAWTLKEAATYMATLALELGDCVLLDDTGLPAHKRLRAHGAVAEAIDASETVWDVGTGQGHNYQVDEWLLIDDEVVSVQSAAADTITVARGQAGTTANTHDNGTTLYLCPVKWEIVGWRPEPEQWKLRYRLQEMPAHVASVWLEETTQTLSANKTTFGAAAVAQGVTVTVAAGVTWTGLAA